MDLAGIVDSAADQVRAIMERDGIPGVAVALVSGDAPAWSECFGVAGCGGSRPIDPDTIFSLQSTSKTFTATAVMLAVQEGLLDLDAPITDYLPGFTVHTRFERDPQRKMTLRHLLSHRAGFTHEAPLGGNFDPELESAAPSFEAHLATIPDTWLRYPVGQRYAYSNLGIDLAGAILMKAIGAPFAECLRRLVFEPLGMADSTADAAIYAARGNRAVGHQPGFEAVPVRIPIEASGGVYSSVADMTRFARFHLGQGRFEGAAVLGPALWEEMHRPCFDGFPYALGILREALRFERARAVLFNHDGGGYGFGSCLTYCPEHRLAWIALFNGQTRPGPPAPFDDIALSEALSAKLGPRALAPRRPADKAGQPSQEALAPYVGSYVAGLRFLTLGWEDGAFGFRALGDEAQNPLAFTGPDRAFVSGGPREGLGVRLHPRSGAQPAWVQFEAEDVDPAFAFLLGAPLDLNEGEGEPPGAIGDAYDRFLGDYRIVQWGVAVMTVSLTKARGSLWLGALRLVEHAPGLLFSADGELLDLTREPPAFRNIPLSRVETGGGPGP